MATKNKTVEKVKETTKKAGEAVEKAVKTAKPKVEKAVKSAKPKVEKATKKATEAVKNVTSKTTEEIFIEFGGKSINANEVVENVKKAYKADGNKAAVKKVQVYIKPDEGVCYYVVNDKAEGKKIDL